MDDVVLSHTDIDPTQEERVMAYLVERVEQLIAKADSEHTGNNRQPDKPLVRIRVDYSDGFTSFNIRRFGQQFVDRVANPKDILLFYRRKTQLAKGEKKDQQDIKLPHLRPEALDTIRMEDLIKEYLTSKDNALELRILTEGRMAQALREFVEKDEKEAISTLVKWQLDQAQEHLKVRQNVHEDNIESEVLKHTEEIRQREGEGDDEDAEDIRKVLAESRASQPNKDDDDHMNGSSDEDRPSTSKGTKGDTNTSVRGAAGGRGRGRGRGRGGRGRGRGASQAAANTSQTVMDSFSSAAKKRRQPSHVVEEVISDNDDDDEFNIPLSSSVKKTKATQSTRGRRKQTVISHVDNGDDSEDSDDPFSMQPSNKRGRR